MLLRWNLSPGGYYLVVCRLEPENHVREILEGLSQSSSTRTMIVVGNDQAPTAYVSSLKRIADSRIRFLGTIYDQAQLQALRFHALAYCHGHSVGGTNPSLLEALGCGNAVLAHDNVFNREVARDAALYFGTAAEFRSVLERFEQDGPGRARMRERAREIVRADYTWDGIAQRYAALIDEERAQS